MKNFEESNQEKGDAAKREEEILALWEREKVFEKTLAKDAPEGEFVFYEGPPTANGMPHMGHFLTRAFKDAIPRYKTMQGFHVRRKAGWDTHGLPVELEVEKQLGLKSKKEIEAYGVAAFNKECKESVWKYVDEWKEFSRRIAYWLDYDDAYVTYYPSYIESVWNILRRVNERGLLYKDYKVVPWCPRCGTALSSHELAQGYAEIEDTSVYVEFKVHDEQKNGKSSGRSAQPDIPVFLLAWTTTPWTLPGNVALAVHPDVSYVEIEKKDMGVGNSVRFILAKDRLAAVFGNDEYEVVREMKGSELVGLAYEPLFPYFADTLPESEKEKLQNAYKVYAADFVSTDEGTGIVHTAVMYGQDDFELGTKVGLPKHHLVGDDGRFTNDAGPYAGTFVKDADKNIIDELSRESALFKTKTITHTYPFCWRCQTPLIYYARNSWFIRMFELRKDLMKENEKINWVPAHIKEGRFGEWLKEVKDWAVSRERYWGTPLPVWECAHCTHKEVVGSVAQLGELSKKSGNKYFVMRHGQGENNLARAVNARDHDLYPLTEKGRAQAASGAEKLRGEGINVIVSSHVRRCRETAEITATTLGIPAEKIVFDRRLGEFDVGVFEGKTWPEYHEFAGDGPDAYLIVPEGGENRLDLKRRAGDFLYEIEKAYSGKTILIVTHDATAIGLLTAAEAASRERSIELSVLGDRNMWNYADVRELPFTPLPHDEDYELDLHKPYIDECELQCPKCEAILKRTPEVMDVWFDSGSMPFAQDHYPFADAEPLYPADYISEGLDQTRGWFYTLHAVGALMERGQAYKNVICLGLLLDAKGKKMSKSVGNVVSPWDVIPKYGADVLRFWMYSINQPGDDKNFDEQSVKEVERKVFTILRNVVNFYELYAQQDASHEMRDAGNSPRHALDEWILARLNQLIEEATRELDAYHLFEAAREIRDFVNDLSTWYIRRSRDRFKTEGEDKTAALATTRHVLVQLSKLMAPLTPFFAEEVYQTLKSHNTNSRMGANDTNKESVHLEEWPKVESRSKNQEVRIMEEMEEVRRIVSLALEQRSQANIKVRQPLASLKIRDQKSEIQKNDQLLQLIKDEINVKEVMFDESPGWEVELDTTITPELKKEGQVRDLIRFVQDLRKKAGLSPHDSATLIASGNEASIAFFEENEASLRRAANIASIKEEAPVSGELFQSDDIQLSLAIQK